MSDSNQATANKVIKTDQQWQRELDPSTYQITRQGGTEPAFTGMYWDAKEQGVYRCKCCHTKLFSSDDKYDSGSGWPSFDRPIDATNIDEHQDNSHGMRRTEVTCAVCDAHLGHVFEDGPNTTGLRYCINSASLDLDAERSEYNAKDANLP